MKKTLAMLLAAILLLSLAACRQETADSTSSPASEEMETISLTAEPSQAAEEPTAPFATTMEETVLVDESNVKITATGLKYTADHVKVSLAIENNSDKNLSFYAGTLGYNCNAINGYMVDDGYLNVDVAAGKKANETVSFSVGELTLLGLTDIADIELGFSITDDQNDTYLKTGPRQLKTSLADSYDYALDTYRAAIADGRVLNALGGSVDCDSDEMVYDQKGVQVLSQTLVTNSSGEQILLVEVGNTSANTVYVSVGDVVVNGLSIQSGTWSTNWISAGKRRVIYINLADVLDKSLQEAFSIDQIGSVAHTLEVKDLEWDTLVNPQPITFAASSNTSFDANGEELYQGEGIRVVSKGLAADSFELSDDIHLLLLVENNTGRELNFNVDYGSVSVNGYMTTFICYGRWVDAGGHGALDVELTSYALEGNGITELSDITEVELTLEVKDDSYKTVAEPTVTVTFGQ